VSYAVRLIVVAASILIVAVAGTSFQQASPSAQQQPVATTGAADRSGAFDTAINQNAQRMIEEGRRIFRFDTT
jgi:hypothetical protein